MVRPGFAIITVIIAVCHLKYTKKKLSKLYNNNNYTFISLIWHKLRSSL